MAQSLKARFITKNILSFPHFLPDLFPCSVPTQLYTLVFQAIQIILCYSNTLECVTFCWSVVNLSGATLLEKMDPSSLTSLELPVARERTSHLVHVCMMGFGLTWVSTDLVYAQHAILSAASLRSSFSLGASPLFPSPSSHAGSH